MDCNSFKNYIKPLESLNPNEILGNAEALNSDALNSDNPIVASDFKLPVGLSKKSASSIARTLSLTRSPRHHRSSSRTRLFSETDISPTHQDPKSSKMSMSEDRFNELIK